MTEEEPEITRRAVSRMTLEEWRTWMQNRGEDLPVTTVLGKQGGVRACNLLAAEYMGLCALEEELHLFKLELSYG